MEEKYQIPVFLLKVIFANIKMYDDIDKAELELYVPYSISIKKLMNLDSYSHLRDEELIFVFAFFNFNEKQNYMKIALCEDGSLFVDVYWNGKSEYCRIYDPMFMYLMREEYEKVKEIIEKNKEKLKEEKE